MSISENVDLHLKRVIEEHITTLVNFPSSVFGAAVASNTRSDQEAAFLRLKAHTADQIEALESLTKLVSQLHVASSLRVEPNEST